MAGIEPASEELGHGRLYKLRQSFYLVRESRTDTGLSDQPMVLRSGISASAGPHLTFSHSHPRSDEEGSGWTQPL